MNQTLCWTLSHGWTSKDFMGFAHYTFTVFGFSHSLCCAQSCLCDPMESLSMEYSRRENSLGVLEFSIPILEWENFKNSLGVLEFSIPILEWVAIPFSRPGDLSNPGTEPRFPALQADVLPSEPPGKPSWEYSGNQKATTTILMTLTIQKQREALSKAFKISKKFQVCKELCGRKGY